MSSINTVPQPPRAFMFRRKYQITIEGELTEPPKALGTIEDEEKFLPVKVQHLIRDVEGFHQTTLGHSKLILKLKRKRTKNQRDPENE